MFSANQIAQVLLVFYCLGVMQVNAAGWVVERDSSTEEKTKKTKFNIEDVAASTDESDVLMAAYQQAKAIYQQRLKPYWSTSEVSGVNRWVTYADDLKTKRVVDFKRNSIDITVDNKSPNDDVDFVMLSELVNGHLIALLSTTVYDALNDDPLYQAIQKIKGQKDASFEPHDTSLLVFSELFTQHKATKKAVDKVASGMMKKASVRYHDRSASMAPLSVGMSKKITYVVPLPDDRIRKKVREYRPVVRENAKRFGLSEEIVMAIIHTESHFNPLARSSIPAFGLMQIVPATAGRDAANKLFKKPKLLSAKYLFNPLRNIEVGSAYLYVLYYEYLKGIKNPESRLYAAIAAYNGGASKVAKAFIGKASFQDALPTINQMTPEEVLSALIANAPRRETREYLRKVLERRHYYKPV